MSPPRISFYKITIRVLAILIALAAVGLFFASLLSFYTLRSIVLSAIPPGYDDRFTPALYARAVLGMRLVAGILGVAAMGLIFQAERLSHWFAKMARDLIGLLREMRDTTGLKGSGAVLHRDCLGNISMGNLSSRHVPWRAYSKG